MGLALRGESRVFSRVAAGAYGSSQFATGATGNLLCYLWLQDSGASSRVEAGNSGFLSGCDMDLRVPTEFQQRSQSSSRVEAWNSAFLWSCEMGVWPPVEFRLGGGGGEIGLFQEVQQGSQTSVRV